MHPALVALLIGGAFAVLIVAKESAPDEWESFLDAHVELFV